MSEKIYMIEKGKNHETFIFECSLNDRRTDQVSYLLDAYLCLIKIKYMFSNGSHTTQTLFINSRLYERTIPQLTCLEYIYTI